MAQALIGAQAGTSGLGALLRAERAARGMGVRALARRVGCSVATVRALETGAPVTLRTLMEIAQALGVVLVVQVQPAT